MFFKSAVGCPVGKHFDRMPMCKGLIYRLLVSDTDSWFFQMFRYAIVGGVSFAVDYGLLYVLTECFGFHYLLSATISFIAGLAVNYLISIRWVFGKSKLSSRAAEFAVYGIIGVVGLLLNNLLLYLFTDHLHLHYMLSKLIASAIVLAWNFLGRKIILFKH